MSLNYMLAWFSFTSLTVNSSRPGRRLLTHQNIPTSSGHRPAVKSFFKASVFILMFESPHIDISCLFLEVERDKQYTLLFLTATNFLLTGGFMGVGQLVLAPHQGRVWWCSTLFVGISNCGLICFQKL